jgi:hypothetical protein
VQLADHEKCTARSEHRPLLVGVQGVSVAAHPVALALDVDNGGVVPEPVQDRRRHDLVGEDRSPIGEPPVGGQHDRAALVAPGDDLPFSTWSLSKLAEFLVADGVVDDISHEGLRDLLRKEGVRFQVIKKWKTSTNPDYEAKKNRVLELYDIADGKTAPGEGDPQIVFCMDEFGPLSLLPRPGKQWAPAATKAAKGSDRAPRRATYTRAQGVRHLMAALNLMTDHMFGHVKTNKNRTTFLAFCRYLRSLYPPEVRIAIAMDNSAHTCQPRKTNASGTGRRRTTSSWPTSRRTRRG